MKVIFLKKKTPEDTSNAECPEYWQVRKSYKRNP